MPEFMLTSDASNANYSSTMVAEGPAMRMFARLQADLVNDDLEVMWRVVRAAVEAGGLPQAALDEIEIQVSPPSLEMRDQKQEAEVHEIEYRNGILSPQTWSRRRGLDYDQEQANLVQHNQRPQELQGPELLAPPLGTPLGESLCEEIRDLVSRIAEAEWDPAKHPRGGNPQNRGEFSTAGGSGAAHDSRRTPDTSNAAGGDGLGANAGGATKGGRLSSGDALSPSSAAGPRSTKSCSSGIKRESAGWR